MHALIDCVVVFHEATSMEVWYNNTSLHFDGFIVMKETKKRQRQLPNPGPGLYHGIAQILPNFLVQILSQ